MKESVITTGEALKMALGMSTLELVVALALLVVVGYLLQIFYRELHAIVRALDDEAYERYLAASGKKRERRKPKRQAGGVAVHPDDISDAVWKATYNMNDKDVDDYIVQSGAVTKRIANVTKIRGA